jgi:hypothetical protein
MSTSSSHYLNAALDPWAPKYEKPSESQLMSFKTKQVGSANTSSSFKQAFGSVYAKFDEDMRLEAGNCTNDFKLIMEKRLRIIYCMRLRLILGFPSKRKLIPC